MAVAPPALAAPAFSCGGFALQGGAQLVCSHIDPTAPAQMCTYSWSLMGGDGLDVVSGSFLLAPGMSNLTVYQGSGFSYAISNPIVLCQGRKAG
jgi:hypothetical protein